MNKGLTNVSNWFNSNKLSLNVKKTKYYFFHKSSKKDNIPLRLPNLNINGFTVERESSIKFLGVWIAGNLTWKGHIHTIENKIAKNIGLLYQGKHYLDDKCLKQIYFAHIHTYLNYVTIAWASTDKIKLKKNQIIQKNALHIMFSQSKTSPSEPHLFSLSVLNVYQINIFQSLQFVHKIKNKNVLHIFLKLFSVQCHVYSTNFSLINFSVPRTFLKITRLAMSTRGPLLWNNCLSKNGKGINNFLLLKNRAEETIMDLSTAANLFQ